MDVDILTLVQFKLLMSRDVFLVLRLQVWQVRASYDQKPYRKLMMQTWGAKVHPSPSTITEAGRRILERDALSPGSLGIAISEAVEVAAKNADTKYCLGSVLNHVLLHQTVIGEECIKQMEAIGETPDVIIGCTGGGSNFAGLAFPFIREKLNGKINPLIRAVEPAACPSLTKGVYAYDYGDTAGMTPLMKMHTLGHDFIPDPIHAGKMCLRDSRDLTMLVIVSDLESQDLLRIIFSVFTRALKCLFLQGV